VQSKNRGGRRKKKIGTASFLSNNQLFYSLLVIIEQDYTKLSQNLQVFENIKSEQARHLKLFQFSTAKNP